MERIYHTWDKWECYPAGFYENHPKDKSLTDDACREIYRDFLADLNQFEAALTGLIADWKNSCEHYLSNERMNRIAWLGQAALCYAKGIPSIYRGGYNMLTDEQKKAADEMALKHLNLWLFLHGHPAMTIEQAQSKTEANLY